MAAAPGDTIQVASGVYQESSGGGDALHVNKSVTITGAGPATYNGSGQWTGVTLITCGSGAGGQALNQVVNVSGNDVTLTQLTVDGRYGFDINTQAATNYGVFVSGQNFSITNAHIVDFTNSGLEFNNSNNGTVTNVSIKRTAFAPGYYAEANSGLRCVDSENLDVDGLTVENARRGIVVFQGDNSGTLDNVTIAGTGTATSSGILFSTSTAPGWWNPAWGSYEGSLTFTLGGNHAIS
ncbi:MAG: right-handed parallel beta-helix repeat-containing protein, partial [Roseimicrobium sp.]